MIADFQGEVGNGIPDQVRRLIWDTFFVSAGRGTAFERHLPWCRQPETLSVALRHPEHGTTAAAIIRPAGQNGVAMVGFVCVSAARRGQGHGRTLVAAVNAALDDAGYQAALLWTGRPAIYGNQGYDVIGQDDFLSVTRLAKAAGDGVRVTTTPWPGPGDAAGLPAFAVSGARHLSDRGEAIVVHGGRGATLVDWHGHPADIVAMMDAAGYGAWSVNVPTGDRAFRDALPADRFAVTIGSGAVTMARRRDAALPIDYVPVVDRI